MLAVLFSITPSPASESGIPETLSQLQYLSSFIEINKRWIMLGVVFILLNMKV